MKIIPIRCKGNRTLPYAKLKTFQGNLKEMSDTSADKLRASILKHGWIAPVFVWGGDYILDGHGRLLVLAELLKGGYTIADLPIVDIEARTKKEAAEILLAISSKFQTITNDGLYQFMYEMDLNLDDLKMFELPDIDIADFKMNFFDEELTTEKPNENYESKYDVIVECENEEGQKSVYEFMTKRGHKCRVLTL